MTPSRSSLNAFVIWPSTVLIEIFKDSEISILDRPLGNQYGSEVETPRNDAGYGFYLKGSNNKNLTPFEAVSSLTQDS